jgi:hypothetical protein
VLRVLEGVVRSSISIGHVLWSYLYVWVDLLSFCVRGSSLEAPAVILELVVVTFFR